jgi:hypothetical protein
MGDIASGRGRFVAGCARCLRTALAGIRVRDDEERQEPGPSFTLAGVRLASSMAVARGSDRLRAALASIPMHDGQGEAPGGDRAGQADLRRRLALASPAVAAGLLAGAVTTTPAGAQEAPASAAPAPAPAQNPPPAPPPVPPNPADPPRSAELVLGAGFPVGGELGLLLNDDGTVQLTAMGGYYQGGKVGVDFRQARAPGWVGEGKGQLDLGLLKLEGVLQGNQNGLGGSGKAQLGPLYGGASVEIVPNPQVDWRAGVQQRVPVPSSAGALRAGGVRYTTPPIPAHLLVNDWQNSQPIDPARFEGVPAQDPYVTFFEWLGDQFGSQGSPQPTATSAPPDWSEAGELGGAYGDQIGVPGATSGSGGLLGQYMEQIAGSAAPPASQGGGPQPLDPAQLGQPVVDAWNEFAESADPSGGLSATAPSPDDLARIGDALSQAWGQLTGTANPPALPGVAAPLPALPPAFDQLLAQDPGLAQSLAQLVPQDPALAQLIVQDPALAQLLAQNPGLAQALAQDPSLAPALSQALAPPSAGEPGPVPGMDWGQILQDMNGPVLVDPQSFQDQPSSYTDDGMDVPAFETDDAESQAETEAETEDDGEAPESDDGDVEEPSDDWSDEEDVESDDDADEDWDDADEDESDDNSDDIESEDDSDDIESEDDSDESDDDSDDSESEDDSYESDDDGGQSDDDSDEWESESDDDGGDESESDDDGGEESESESDDDGGEESESESDGGGGESESDGGGGGGDESGGGGGGGDSAGDGGAPDALAPVDTPDAEPEGGGEEPSGDGYDDGYDYGDFDEGPGAEQNVGGDERTEQDL